jgi:hypothetical protein
MNGRIILLSVLFFIILACHKKGIPTITARQDKPLSWQTENFVTDIDAGRMTFIAKCKRCHVQPDPLTYNAQRWDGILSVMIPRARLTKEEANNVTAYIKANCSK